MRGLKIPPSVFSCFIFFCRIVSPLEGTFRRMYEYIVRPLEGTFEFVCVFCELLSEDFLPSSFIEV